MLAVAGAVLAIAGAGVGGYFIGRESTDDPDPKALERAKQEGYESGLAAGYESGLEAGRKAPAKGKRDAPLLGVPDP